MKLIQVLGPGCAKCEKLKKSAEEAVASLAVEAKIEKVSDISQIMAFGVMSTPALVIDGEVKSAGKVLSPAEIAKLLV